jgi:N-formylglutamate amidohydrolase
MVEAVLARYDSCLIIDAHSFPSKPLPYENDQTPDRPDICLGYTDYHADQELVSNIKSLFETAGLSVALNRPFSGSIVPSRYYMKDRRAQSIMIELNRALYMDEKTGMKNSSYSAMKELIERAIR